MNKKELEFILQKGEGCKIEFKESLDKSIAKEIVASNARGGRIFLGASDGNKVKGWKSRTRNTLAANLLLRAEYAEKLGAGISRIKSLAKGRRLKAKFEVDDFFRLIFYRRITGITAQKILELIKENPRITRKELASAIGISEDGIKFHIGNLKKKGLLKRIGPAKGGYWKTAEKVKGNEKTY